MTITAVDTDTLIRELSDIRHRLIRLTGKLTKQECSDVFMGDESLSEDSRLLASEALDLAYHELWTDKPEFTFGMCANLEVAILRLRKNA